MLTVAYMLKSSTRLLAPSPLKQEVENKDPYDMTTFCSKSGSSLVGWHHSTDAFFGCRTFAFGGSSLGTTYTGGRVRCRGAGSAASLKLLPLTLSLGQHFLRSGLSETRRYRESFLDFRLRQEMGPR